jgi:light-regulated signal transduction histidine kinase (bacteriophytochrome)
MTEISQCDTEKVEFSGATMPHGGLLLLSHEQLQIIGASENCVSILGKDPLTPAGLGLGCIFADDMVSEIAQGLQSLITNEPPRIMGSFPCINNGNHLTILAHRTRQAFILELEVSDNPHEVSTVIKLFADIQYCLKKLQKAKTWLEVMNLAVVDLKRLTGFESVLATRFLDDGSFHAIAQTSEPGFPSYMDKRFPRSDIPDPGRWQMLKMPVQHVPDNNYKSVRLIMQDNQISSADIDLGLATLRSISPMCRRFYQNMGIRSRMLLTLVNNGNLWGFFNCIGSIPVYVSHAERMAYFAFADMAARIAIEKQRSEDHLIALNLKRQILQIGTELTEANCLSEALEKLPAKICEVMDASAAILLTDNQAVHAGNPPDSSLVYALTPWLAEQPACFITDRLSLEFPFAKDHLETACGLMAIRLTEHHDYLLIFRPEWIHEVSWAGVPQKSLEIDFNATELRFTPRGSFEEWKQTVRGLARTWRESEQETLNDLRMMLLIALNTQQLQQMSKRNAESNRELETFSYTVSHDLQEPLRGILNFSEFLNHSLTGKLTAEEESWLATVMKLSTRMAQMVKTLMEYSRATEQPLNIRSIDLKKLLQDVVENLSFRIAKENISIYMPQIFPTIECDHVRTAAIFENLISNACKYNDKAEKTIEVGFDDGNPLVFFVRDNGIGIKPEYHTHIFDIFRRLHSRYEFGGGTGAGLTIARKHVERHGGGVWLESTPGQGTTFYFTLNKAQSF